MVLVGSRRWSAPPDLHLQQLSGPRFVRERRQGKWSTDGRFQVLARCGPPLARSVPEKRGVVAPWGRRARDEQSPSSSPVQCWWVKRHCPEGAVAAGVATIVTAVTTAQTAQNAAVLTTKAAKTRLGVVVAAGHAVRWGEVEAAPPCSRCGWLGHRLPTSWLDFWFVCLLVGLPVCLFVGLLACLGATDAASTCFLHVSRLSKARLSCVQSLSLAGSNHRGKRQTPRRAAKQTRSVRVTTTAAITVQQQQQQTRIATEATASARAYGTQQQQELRLERGRCKDSGALPSAFTIEYIYVTTSVILYVRPFFSVRNDIIQRRPPTSCLFLSM